MHKENELILSTLGIFKIKYSILEKLEINNIDIFHIDLNTIVQILFKIKNIFDDKSAYSFTIASSIINLIAHFRAYFVKKQNDTIIYLYYSYKDKIKNPNLLYNINDAISLLSVIVKYIPKVYLIDDKKIDIKLSMDFFIDENKINYILTKNKILYQFINKNIFILRPARDDSYIITKNNLYNKLTNNDTKYSITHYLLTSILSFSGVNEYKGVKGMGMKKTLNMFQKALDDGIIVNDYYPLISDLLYDLSCDKNTCSIVSEIFENIDASLLKRKNIYKPYDIICNSFIIDRFSKKDLQELNTKYFTGFNSLMLQELLLEPKKSKNNKIKW